MDVSNPTKQGSQRVEIKKVEEESKRLVTFTRRRKGLFNKACKLSELTSPRMAVFDAILDQCPTGKVSDSSSESNAGWSEVELMRKEREETLSKLEEEKKQQRGEKTGFWWEKSVDERLKEDEAALVQLKRNAEGKLEEMRRKTAKASTSSARDHEHDHDHQVRDRDPDHQDANPTAYQLHHDHDHQDVTPTADQLHQDGLVFDDPYRIEDFVGLNEFLNLVE